MHARVISRSPIFVTRKRKLRCVPLERNARGKVRARSMGLEEADPFIYRSMKSGVNGKNFARADRSFVIAKRGSSHANWKKWFIREGEISTRDWKSSVNECSFVIENCNYAFIYLLLGKYSNLRRKDWMSQNSSNFMKRNLLHL